MARYTVSAGRQINRDGKPFIHVGREDGIPPTEADAITHTIARLLTESDHKTKMAERKIRDK